MPSFLSSLLLRGKRISFVLAATAVMAGCGSGVKLDETPVEDRTTPTAPAQSSVAPVSLDDAQGNLHGPEGVERVVYFDFDSYVLKSQFQSLIDAHARYMKAVPSRQLMIEGHTDDRGGREYNLALGQKRAEAVRRAMRLLGVPDSQMEAVSFGKERPAVPGYSEDAHAQNRRAELIYR